MAVFDWYVLLPVLANFKYWINATKARMCLSLVLSKLCKTFWIWYWLSNKPACCVLHFKYPKEYSSVPAGAFPCAFWNRADLLIGGESSLPSWKCKRWKKTTRILTLTFAVGFDREIQHEQILRYIEIQKCSQAWRARAPLASRNISHAALPGS